MHQAPDKTTTIGSKHAWFYRQTTAKRHKSMTEGSSISRIACLDQGPDKRPMESVMILETDISIFMSAILACWTAIRYTINWGTPSYYHRFSRWRCILSILDSSRVWVLLDITHGQRCPVLFILFTSHPSPFLKLVQKLPWKTPADLGFAIVLLSSWRQFTS